MSFRPVPFCSTVCCWFFLMCTCNLAAWGLQVYLFVYDTKKYANSTTVLLHLSPSVICVAPSFPQCPSFPHHHPLVEGDAGGDTCPLPCGSSQGWSAGMAVLQIPAGRKHSFSHTNGWEYWQNPSTRVGNKGAATVSVTGDCPAVRSR